MLFYMGLILFSSALPGPAAPTAQACSGYDFTDLVAILAGAYGKIHCIGP